MFEVLFTFLQIRENPHTPADIHTVCDTMVMWHKYIQGIVIQISYKIASLAVGFNRGLVILAKITLSYLL